MNETQKSVERTTISVTKETKDALNSHRDGQKWDQFLRGLIQNDSTANEGGLTEAHIDDIAQAAAQKTVDELQAVMR